MKKVLFAVVALLGLATVASANPQQFVVVNDHCAPGVEAVVFGGQRQFVVVNQAQVQRVVVQPQRVFAVQPQRFVNDNRQQVVVNNGGGRAAQQQVVVNQGRQGFLQRLLDRNDNNAKVVVQNGGAQKVIVR